MKFKRTVIVFVVFILLFGIFLAVALPSITKRGEDNEETRIEQPPLYAQPLNGALEGASIGIQPMSWWDGIIGGVIGGGVAGAIEALIQEALSKTGTLHAGDYNVGVPDGSYTNQPIGYTANSYFPQHQMWSPNNSGFSTTILGVRSMWSNSNTNGWYRFRGYDPSSGLVSNESKIYLDTVKPQIQVRYNLSNVPNGYITTGSYSFSLLGSDDASGVDTYWYKIGNGSYTQCYSSSSFSSNGVYTFYVKDRAGNISDTVTVTKDTVAPTLAMYNGSTSLSNGAYTNASTIRFEASDATSGVNAIYIKQPNASNFTKFSSSSVSLTAEGYYEFYAIDNAGLSSSTYSVTVDRTAPTMTVKSGSTTLSNNAFINTSSITATSNESGTCYVYKASTDTTSTFTSGSSFTAEDTYKFYSYDLANNKSSEITVTIDRTAPTYNLYAGGTLTTAAYTNAASIYYTASDKNSFTVYVKEPSSSSYVATTNSKTFTAEGVYNFYAIDAAGNQSATKTITVDRTKPSMSLYAGTTAVNSGAYVNSENIYATASDGLSGVKTIYVKLPSGSSYTAYTSGTKLSEQGTYSFYCEDNSGNISSTLTLYLDKTAPVGTLNTNGSAVTNDSFTNKAFSYTATDNLSGISKLEIKKPNGNWESYTSATSVTGVDGVYYFRATDVAGNISLESRINLDTAAPVVQVLGDGIAKATNSFTNAASLQFYAFDSNLTDCYIKVPNDTAFKTVASGISYTAEGRYEFYATDKAGNKSATFVITVDKAKPVGTMSLSADGKAMANGDFTNKSFKYTATDSLSGIARLEVKKPNGAWEAYASGTEIKSGSDGIYYFRAYDNAGNVSDESHLIYDTAAPAVTIFADTAVKPDKSFTNAEFIKFVSDDANLQSCFIKLPSESAFKATTSGVQFTAEGKYEFYAIDKAGNQSATYIITLDRTASVGTLYVGGSVVANNCHTNKGFSYTATDSLSGIARLEVKKPNGAWETYASGTEIKSGSDGIYYFRAYDNAGNVSDESHLIYDTAAPTVTVFAGTAIKPDKSITNAEFIKFVSDDANLQSCFIKLPSESAFKATTSGVQFTAEGKYEFYAIDKAGNQSATYIITLDRTASVGTLYVGGSVVANNCHTNKTFSYTATDSLSGIARLEVKKPNGAWETYASGTEIKSGSDGVYYFRAIDNAGNVSEESYLIYDTTPPTVTVFAATENKPDKSFTNAAYIKFIAEDVNSYTCHIKLPNESVFQITTSGIQFTAEGKYEFYVVDKAGNQSPTYAITLDRTAPTGMITADGNAKANGDFTNKAFKYSATDSLSGIARLEVKKPNGAWETYASGTEIKSGDGVYAFRTIDNAGNISAESFIYFSITAPSVTVFAGANVVPSNAFTNADFIKFEASHLYLDNCYVKLPDSSSFQLTSSGIQFTVSGRYEFYAVDKCGNSSQIQVITLDKIKPVGTLYVGSTAVGNDSFTNKAFKYEADGGLSGLNYCEIKRPNGAWEPYTAGTVIVADNPNGAYCFRSVDNVGNVSFESIIHLDTKAPVASLFADEAGIQSGSFTNALRIKFVCNDTTLASCYVRIPNALGFEPTSSGALYSSVGRYEFYAVDLAGNVSETYIVIVDRTPKTITVGNVTNGKTTKDTQLNWANTTGSAPIVSVTVNGTPVANNAVIKTIDNGRYEVVCLDSAGNIWTFVFTAERTDIETTTTNKYWWEAKGGDGKTYAFETYEKALAFAEQREKALVKTLTWNNNTWDTGYIMDSIDSVNAKQGTFYLYKKHDDPKIEVAYFTLNRLNAVIRYYAEQDINRYYYWERNPAESYAGNDLNKPFTSGTITAKSLSLRSGLTYKIDGVIMSGTSYSVTGKHTLTILDEYGNSYGYDLIIVSAAPDLQFRYGNGDFYSATNEQPYYLKNRITIKPLDFLDEYAVAIVKNSNGEIIQIVNLGEEFIISEVGKYVIQTVNHSGSKEYVFFISYDTPAIYTTKNPDSKRLEVSVKPSIDKDIVLVSLKIYWSANGTNWALLDSDDYGSAIKIDRLKYNFYKSGYYKIVVEDTCRSGIDSIILETYFEKPAPVGTLNGVNENGHAKGAVSFVWKDEAYVILTKDGTEAEYISGAELTEEGSYKLIFCDYNGYEKVYLFVIDKTAATPVLSEEIVGGFAKKDTFVTWEKDGVTAILYFNGINSGSYEKGAKLFADGQYKIVLTDKAGNTSTVEFVIDTTAPTANLSGVANGGQTKSSVQLSGVSENVVVKAYLNGAEFEYKLGSTLDKVGTYKIVLTDEAGNETVYNFEILFSLNASATIFIAIVIIALIGGVALVVIMRKKSKFKTKNKQK